MEIQDMYKIKYTAKLKNLQDIMEEQKEWELEQQRKYYEKEHCLEVINLYRPTINGEMEQELYRLVGSDEYTPREIAERLLDWKPCVPSRLSKPAKELFDTLGRRSTFLYRLIFANLGLFKGLLDKICKKSGGELNALMRTTVAFTQMSGSKGMNVLPPHAEMVANLRIMCGENVQSCVDYLKKTIGDDAIKTEVVYGMDPSNVSETKGEAWEMMKRAVSQTWKDTLVAPYLMLACSDSRHYGEISDHVYRFSAMALSKEERASIHGNDEKIPTEKIVRTVHFYLRLLSQF